jgi:uncharacterized protein
MFEVNIHHIPESGLKLSKDLPEDILEIKPDSRLEKISPIKCKFYAQMVNNDLVVRGSTQLEISCKCDRCLIDIDMEIESDDVCLVYEKCPDIVDLTNDIREDILLAFPQIYLCEVDCKGLCFSCGQNLNEGPCQCNDNSETTSPWDALKSLNFDDQK